MEERLYIVLMRGPDPNRARTLAVTDNPALTGRFAKELAAEMGLDGPNQIESSFRGPQLVPNESPAQSLARQEAEREREAAEGSTRWLLELHRGSDADPTARVVWTDDAGMVGEFSPRIRAAGFDVSSSQRPALLVLRSVDARNPSRPGPLPGASTTDPEVIADFARRVLAEEDLATPEERAAVEDALAAVEAEEVDDA